MSEAWFTMELERALHPPSVRVVAAAGVRVHDAMRSLSSELADKNFENVLTDGLNVGVSAGGGVESLVRGFFALPADSAAAWGALEAKTTHSDVQGRELLGFAAGLPAREGEQSIGRLDSKTRWESALAEFARWLSEHNQPWVWLITDAMELDAESVRLLSLIAGLSHPALIVLGCENATRGDIELKFEALNGAKLLQHATHSIGSRASMPPLAPLDEEAQRLVKVLEACGGRLPQSALEREFPGCEALIERLRAHGAAQAGTTRRSGDDREVWLLRPGARGQSGEVPASIGAWAEERLQHSKLEGVRALVLPLAIRAAEVKRDVVRQSLGWELLAREASGSKTSECLAKAEALATGVRRLVLARRLAEDAVFRGDLKRAAEVLATSSRLPVVGATELPAGWEALIDADAPDELEQWRVLTPDEAQTSLELGRAEVLAAQAQTNETKRAFQNVEARLAKLKPSKAASALWLRTARTWSHFAAETLGDGAMAREFCARAREKAGPEAVRSGFHAPAFIRAAQIAESHGGDAAKARSLADELISVARARGDVRDECIAWNARSILFLRDGELLSSRKGFETSLAMARSTGFRRREAIALHNLGLVLAAAGEFSDAVSAQEQYLAISEQIGNVAARAYAPAAMAQALVVQLETAKAEPLIARARRAAEDNQWIPLIAWSRHLTGLLKLLAWTERKDNLMLTQARLEFLACLDLHEERAGGWSEEVDPAEVGACLAVSWLAAGQRGNAEAAAKRAAKYEKESACSELNVRAVKAVLAGASLDEPLAWLEERGQLRLAQMWRRIGAALKS